MYSGIIKQRAKIESVKNDGVGRKFSLDIPMSSHYRLEKGESISLNGVCFTVLEKGLRTFDVEAMPQTLRLTTVGDWNKGDLLNFESPLKVGDEVGGHFIYGHVDGVGVVEKNVFEGSATVLSLRAPEEVIEMLVPRASVAIDGVSLTVVAICEDQFTVSLLPETLKATTLGKLKEGGKANLEIDMLMRYAYKHVQKH